MIGDEARAQLLEQAGRLPDRAVACVGGGSNAIGTFIPFVNDEEVELIGVEAAGEGLSTRRHSAPLTTGARGVLHGALTAVLQDEDGPDPRGALDLGRARLSGGGSRARVAARLGPGPIRGRRGRRGARGVPPGRPAGGHPAGARVVARDRVGAREPVRGTSLVTLSGRGDKDLAEVLALAVSVAASPIAGAFSRARQARRSDAVPDGRVSEHRRIGRGGVGGCDAGADLLELGIPFSDPLADGPVIHAAGTAALAAGATPHSVLGVANSLR